MTKDAFHNIQKKLGLTNEGISEALDVELFTVRQWASGLWPVPRPIAKFLHSLLSMKRDNEAIYMAGHGKGRLTGYDDGYLQGKAEGRREGQNKGYTAGFNDGYAEGHSEGIDAGSGY